MKTNREWLAEMDNHDLSKFLTVGVEVRATGFHSNPFLINISSIARHYTSSARGIEMWLSEPQQYEVEKAAQMVMDGTYKIIEINDEECVAIPASAVTEDTLQNILRDIEKRSER